MLNKMDSLKILSVTISILVWSSSLFANISLLNVSYDPTRELYQEFNSAFGKYWKIKTGEEITVHQSHGGSGKQARSVIDGLEADVITLALAYDIDAIAHHAKLLPDNWQTRLPFNSTPYSSTVVFLVRKGNPKKIKNWDDLVRSGVTVITPNPKTSGGARWNYLAAWGYAMTQPGDPVITTKRATSFITQLFKNVPVLDTGARGATTTFIERGIGDVLLAWENEALLAVHGLGKNQFEIVMPSISILAEPPVAVVDSVAIKHKTLQVAEAYLKYLYSEEGQQIVAKHYYRPRMKTIVQANAALFPAVKLLTIDDKMFGGWKRSQETHFNDGGIFDQIYH